MGYVNPLIETYPRDSEVDVKVVARCVQACHECAQACTACAEACLSEPNVAELVRCIRSDQNCADLCVATARVVSRHSDHGANATRAVLEACALVCAACGDECETHAGMHEHCRIGAEACRRCELACRELLEAIGP